MKLFLHNFLQDNVGDKPGYPLTIEVSDKSNIVETKKDFNENLMRVTLRKINFPTLQKACEDLGIEFHQPVNIEDPTKEELTELFHILFEIEIMEGTLISPLKDSDDNFREFPISNGIPDMCPEIGRSK